MKATPTDIPDVILLTPDVFGDDRGYLLETWSGRVHPGLGIDLEFKQDNLSHSRQGILRGLHYQVNAVQGKLIQVINGTIFDVAVDMRRSSPTYGRWVSEVLSGETHQQLWIPPGFAHGFYVLSEKADVLYKCTDYYSPEDERTVRWNDPTLLINWPLEVGGGPILSERDRERSCPFAEAEAFE